MRREIASLAARLMAQDGISDYGFAKRKAARQLGASETEALPNNSEIEAELRAYQSLYQGDETRVRLSELRATALDVMRFLEHFTPYLHGHVLEGTAGRFAEVELLLFAGSSKEVELYLLNCGIEYAHQAARRGAPESLETTLGFRWKGTPVVVQVFGEPAERQHRRNPRNGRVAERASLGAVEAMVRGEP